MNDELYEEYEDHCYECEAYGDDYYTDEEGNMIPACDDCPYNEFNWNDGYWKDDY